MAKRPSTFGVSLENYQEVLGKLDADKLYGKAWKHALEQAAKFVKGQAEERVPVRSGKAKDAMTMKMGPGSIPLYAVVSNDVDNKGFRYPFALDAKAMHYRKGARAGQSTKEWFYGVAKLATVKAKIGALLDQCADKIVVAWNKDKD